MDEARLGLIRSVHDRLVVGGHLDVVAEHVVVPDFQRADAGLLDEVALHAGDDPARLVAQRPHLVELAVIEPAQTKSAVALQERQLVAQRPVEVPRADRRGSAARASRAATSSGGSAQPSKQRVDRAPPHKASPQSAKVARSAAVQRQPRQRPRNVRRRLQRLAQCIAQSADWPRRRRRHRAGRSIALGSVSGAISRSRAAARRRR